MIQCINVCGLQAFILHNISASLTTEKGFMLQVAPIRLSFVCVREINRGQSISDE